MTTPDQDDAPLQLEDETVEETAASGMSQTDWSLVNAAAQDGEDGAAAMEQLSGRYWPAIYAFIRATGRSVEESSDLTQGFICDVVLARRLVETADRSRGRFRSLMLKSLQNYLRQQHRYQTRQKRSHEGKQPINLAEDDGWAGVRADSPQPTDRFIAEWRTMLVRRVLESVRAECERDGLENHWAVFEFRVARPMLLGEPAVPYQELLERFNLQDISQASNMMITVKRRVARSLRAEVHRTVSDPAQVDDELRELLGRQEWPS